MTALTNLFGNTKVNAPPQIQFTPPGFNAGGLKASFSGNDYSVTPDATRTGAVNDISNNFGDLGNQYGALRQTVAPGFNDLLKSRLASFNNDASSAIGTLNKNLQSRRVLGSSFGQDTITRAQNQFAQQRDAIVTDNFQKSLEENNKLLTQQYNSYNSAFQNKLSELNLEASTAASLTSGASSLLAANAQAQAKLNEQSAEFNATMSNNQSSGFGSFLGKTFGPMLGSSMGSLFGGAAGAAGAGGSAAAAAGMGTAADSAALLAELGPMAMI